MPSLKINYFMLLGSDVAARALLQGIDHDVIGCVEMFSNRNFTRSVPNTAEELAESLP